MDEERKEGLHAATCCATSESVIAISLDDEVTSCPGTSRDKGAATSNSAGKYAIEISGDTYIIHKLKATGTGDIQLGRQNLPNRTPVLNSNPIGSTLLQTGLRQLYELEEDWYHPIEGLNSRPHLLEKYYVELQFGEIDRSGFVVEDTIPVEDVFSSRESVHRRPTRILVTGEAGYGKSTLCKKLVHDWVEKSEYISQFEIVILVRLRAVTTTIEDAVIQLCTVAMGSKYEDQEVLPFLQKLENKCLLILDGYDELNETAKPSLRSVLEHAGDESFLKLTTVLMTSRPENQLKDEMNLTRAPLVGKIIRSNVCHAFKTFLNLAELTNESQVLFIEKYFKEDEVKAESLKQHILKTKMKLTRSPLLLHIMCYIYEHGTEVNADGEFWEQYIKYTREQIAEWLKSLQN